MYILPLPFRKSPCTPRNNPCSELAQTTHEPLDSGPRDGKRTPIKGWKDSIYASKMSYIYVQRKGCMEKWPGTKGPTHRDELKKKCWKVTTENRRQKTVEIFMHFYVDILDTPLRKKDRGGCSLNAMFVVGRSIREGGGSLFGAGFLFGAGSLKLAPALAMLRSGKVSWVGLQALCYTDPRRGCRPPWLKITPPHLTANPTPSSSMIHHP